MRNKGFAVAGFSFDADAAGTQLDRLIGEYEDRQRAYQSGSPSFPQRAAGQGFSGHGQRIAEMLQSVHEAGRARAGALAEGCRFARQVVAELQETDIDFGTSLKGLR